MLHIPFSQAFNNTQSGEWLKTLDSVRPQMVDFDSEQGLSDFETAGIVGYVEDFKRAITTLRIKRCHLWMDTK